MTRRPAIRRLALASALCLAGGATATVLVAWGFGLLATVEPNGWPQANWNALPQEARPWCKSQSENSLVAVVRYRGAGLRDDLVESVSHDELLESRPTDSLSPIAFSELVIHRSGWPRCALRTVYECDPFGMRPDAVFEPGLEVPAWLARPVYAPTLGSSASQFPRPLLPLHPIPLGFTLDTLFYAALLAALFLAPPRLRRFLRLRRGLCPACGYDLAGNTTGICPECGAAATKEAKA